MSTEAVKVVITGGAGQIAYSLIPSLLSGSVFGPSQPVYLVLLDIPPSTEMLRGVVMEVEDLAYPLCAGVLGTTDAAVGFRDADVCIFLGAFPRREGMERKDVMARNVGIFQAQGSAVAAYAKPSVKCLVVGNPANTNAAILLGAMQATKAIDCKSITALTRLDHNRASAMVAAHAGVSVGQVQGVVIWGNHSSTQYPDVRHASIIPAPGEEGVPVLAACEASWLEGDFITKVQKRGAAIIEARKLSSAMSAAKAIADHLRDWLVGSEGKIVSMGVFAEGGEYGVPSGICFSLPCTCSGGAWHIVPHMESDEFSAAKFKVTLDELIEEKALATKILMGE